MQQHIPNNKLVNLDIQRKHNAIVRGNKGVGLEHVITPSVGSGELLVAPIIVGLCGTDIQILRGERNDPSKIIGHEGVAKIIKVGHGCPTNLKIGDNVIINPTHPYNEKFLLGHNIDGLFQEYVHIQKDAVVAGLVIPVLEEFPLELAPLIEPLAAVIYSFRLLQPHGGTIIIYGDGIIGHLAVLLARIRFGSFVKIIFVHHRQEGLFWSIDKKIHGDWDILSSELTDSAKLANLPMADLAIIATPRSGTLECLEHAVANIASGGRIDLLAGVPDNAHLLSLPGVDLVKLRKANCGGIPTSGVFIHAKTILNKPVVLFGHRGVSAEHLILAMKELSINRGIYTTLITHELNLHEAASFMNNLANFGCRKINSKRVMKLSISIDSSLYAGA